MPGQITNYGAQSFLSSFFGKAFTPPNTFWIALIPFVEPSVSSTGSDIIEPAADSYQRAQYPNSVSNWTITSNETVSNAKTIEFPIANEYWGEVNYFAICNRSTGGDVLAYGSLLSSEEILENDIVVIDIGSLSFTLFNLAYEGD